MLNTSLNEAIKAARSVDAGTGKVWSGTVEFVMSLGDVDHDSAKEAFKMQEAEYEEANKVQPKTFSAYRSAKSVALSALKNNIDLHIDGKIRGKTEIEKAIKDAKSETKSPFDKWQQMFERLNEQTNTLIFESDVRVAYQSTDKLLKKLAEMYEGVSVKAA